MLQKIKKTYIVTGASNGIGKAVAEKLYNLGHNVVLVSRNLKTNKKIFKNKKKFLCFKGDLINQIFIKKFIADAYKKFGRIDGLFNIAGISSDAKIDNINLEDWNKIINNNLTSTFLCSKFVIPYLKKNSNKGIIINTSSIAGRSKSIIAGVHYTASKAAIIGFTRQLAFELSKFAIRVNCVAPGQTKTKMLEKAIKKNKINLNNLKKNIPIGRIAKPEEVADVMIFLSTDSSSYLTGSIIDVNGGVI